MVTVNRIAEHVGAEQAVDVRVTPPLVELRHRVRGMCDFHIVCVRSGVYQVRVGRSADAVVNFRHHPDLMEDSGHGRASHRLRAVLKRCEGKEVKFDLEQLECSADAVWMAERVGSAINGWRLGSGRADFPSAADVAQMVGLPEPMVKVALRDYVRAG